MQQLRFDLLGAVKYPKQAVKGARRGSCIAVLDRVFLKKAKPHNELYRRILNHRKGFSLVVHATWNGSHVYGQKELEKAKKAAKRVQKIVDELGAADRVFFSPFLEHRNKTPFINSAFSEIQAVAPRLQLVNSYISGGVERSGINEIHHDDHNGKPPGDYFFSLDGVDARQVDIQYYKTAYGDALQFGMWIPEFNGKSHLTDSTPPLQRDNWPTVKQIRQVGKLYTDGNVGGGIPSHQLKFSLPNLWEPNASDGNLVVLLRGDWPRAERAKVKRKNGTWETLRDTGYANPWNGVPRLHLRASKSGSNYASKKKGGGIRFEAAGRVYEIPLPGKAGERHD